MNKVILVGASCLVVGFFAGFYLSNHLNRSALTGGNNASTSAPNLPQTQAASIKEGNAPALPGVTEALDAAKNRPDDFDAQMNAGDIYLKIQNFEKAAGYYEAAAALKPTDREKIVKLANSLFDTRPYEKAAEFYERALQQKSDDVAVRTDFGITFVKRTPPDYPRAIKEFEESLKLGPDHPPTLYNIIFALNENGDAVNARKYFDRFNQKHPNSELVARLKQLFP